MNVDFAITSPESWVSESLDTRAKAILNPRTSKWATQRTVWARAISSAIIPSDPSLNKTHILYSGTQTTSATSYSTTFRPTYGIDNIKVDFKGTMGSTKTCTVSFKCWTLDDLHVLEKLYMIPGISVIVEWGYSMDTDGAPVGPEQSFLDLGPMSDPYSKIMDTIIRNRKTYLGNYDGLVGIITNFNYKLNDSLGFDCEFELVAPGEMWLEQNLNNTSKQASSVDSAGIEKYSNLVFVFNDLYTRYKSIPSIEALNKKLLGKPKGDAIVVIQQWETEAREYDKAHRSGWYDKIKGAITDTFGATESWETYISWAYFVQLLNTNINKYRLEDNGTITEQQINAPDIALALDFIPVTLLPKACTLDPRICTFKTRNIDLQNASKRFELLATKWERYFPNLNGINLADRETDKPIYPSTFASPDLNDSAAALSHIEKFGTTLDIKNAKENIIKVLELEKQQTVGFLNNVYMNTGFLRDAAIVNSGEQLTIDDYLKNVLGELNKATGDVWNLQYRTDEANPHLIHIFDANYTSKESREVTAITPFKFKLKDSPSLLLHGAGVESKLVDGFKNLVLFGNSTDNGSTDTANIGMQLYADKVTDGWKEMQAPDENIHGSDTVATSADGELHTDITEVDPEADLDLAYATLLDYVTDESVASSKTAMSSYISWLQTNRPETAITLPSNQNILLPFNFTAQLDGYSGLVWGNTINFDYLPTRYEDRVFFQIIKIQHEINSNNWVTNIDTIMRLRPDPNVKNPVTSNKLQSFLDKGKEGIFVNEHPQGSVQQNTTYAAESTGTKQLEISNKIKRETDLGTNTVESADGDLNKFFTNNK